VGGWHGDVDLVEHSSDGTVSAVSTRLVEDTMVAAGRAASPAGAMAAHEWRLLRADRMLRVIAILFAALLVAALVNGVRWTRFQAATLSELRTADAARFSQYVDTLRQMAPDAKVAGPFAPDPRNPMTIGSRGGTLAALDPAPLSALAVGQSDLLPYYLKVNTGGRQGVLKGDEIENPGNLLTGRFDLAFVIVVLFPLVILALSYNMLSGEREDGTLALVMSQPVQLRTLLLAKIGVRALVVLLIAFVLVGAGLVAARVDIGAAGTLASVFWWFLIVTAYAAFWFGVALVVNAVVRGSAAAAVASVSVWLVLVVLAPVLVNLVAQTQYPTPSRVAFVSMVRSVTNEANAVSDKLMSKYLVDHPELAGAGVDMSDFWTRSLTVQDTVEKTLAPHYADFEQQLARQQAVITGARVLTPALLVQTALEDLAGTGLPRWQAFRDQTLLFHRQWQDYFIGRQIRQQKLTAADVASVPQFTYREEAADAVRERVLMALLWLLVPAVALWALGFARLRRYSVV
jgi:ABC-2 type transport system permease protein